MAASTLATLLIKLGFDVSGLATGGKIARSQLDGIKASAASAGAVLGTTAASLNHLTKASNLVAGSAGAATTLGNLAKAATAVSAATGGAAGPMNNFARSAETIASTTGSGAAVNAYARAVERVAGVAGASAVELNAFARAAAAVAAATGSAGAVINYARGVAAAPAAVAAGAGVGAAAAGVGAAGAAAAGAAAPLAAAGAAAAVAAPAIARVGVAGQAAAGGLGAIPANANRAAASMNNVAHAAMNAADRGSFMNRTLSMAFAFSGGVAVTNIIGFLGNALLGFNSRLEQAHIAFKTLLGDSGDADQFIADMEAFANVTPFEFSGLQDAVQRLLAMGFAAEDTLPVLRAVGDAVAALGGDKEKLDRVTLALGQMITAGRVNSQDMRQLTEAGIPAWRFLAEGIGKTVAETRKLAENGLIPAGKAVSILVGAMEQDFGGMMAKQARTAMGALSTLKDAMLQSISGAVKPLYDALAQTAVGLADFFINGGMKYVAPVIWAIGAAIAIALIPRLYGAAVAAASASVAFGSLTLPLSAVIVAVTAVGMAWQENWGGIRDTLGPVLETLGAVASKIIDVLGQLGFNAKMLVVLITALAAAITGKLVASMALAIVTAVRGTSVNLAYAASLQIVYVGAAGASQSIVGFAGVMNKTTAIMGGAAGAVGLWIAAAVLLITNFDRVSQGVRLLAYYFVGAIKWIVEAAAQLPFVGDAFKGLAAGLKDIQNEIVRSAAEVEAKIQSSAENMSPSTAAAEDWDTWIADFKAKMSDLGDGGASLGGTQTLVEQFGTSMNAVYNAARESGGKLMLEMADGIRDAQEAPMNALKALHTGFKRAMTPLSETALLYGILASKDLARGLQSGDASVRARAIGLQKTVMERLAQLPPNAALAGLYTSRALANGLVDPKAIAGIKAALNVIGRLVGGFFDRLTGGVFSKFASQLNATLGAAKSFTDASKWMNDQLALTDDLATAAAGSLKDMRDEEYALGEAWKTIEDTAKKYFDFIHDRNLKAIQDAHDLADAQLDAAEMAARKPAKDMSAAYNAMKDARKLAELQKAVADAQAGGDQKALFEAQQALSDFQTEQEITRLTDIGEAQVSALEAQRKMNDDLLKQQQEAENLRYNDQRDAFEKELEQLKSYLDRHPEAWAATHAKIIRLLDKFGITYTSVGSSLGLKFAKGLDSALDAIKDSARLLGEAAAAEFAKAAKLELPKEPVKPPEVKPPPLVVTLEPGAEPSMGAELGAAWTTISNLITNLVSGSGIDFASIATGLIDSIKAFLLSLQKPESSPRRMLAEGMWSVPFDNLPANLHAEEMVVPAGPARLLRDLLAGGASSGGWQTTASGGGAAGRASALTGGVGGRGGGGGTIVIELDGEVLTRVVDRRLAIREDLITALPVGGPSW